MKLHPPGDYLSDLLRMGQTWEPEVVQAVVDRCSGERGCIVDVGAMLGTHTMAWAKALPNMTIHAVEPDPVNMACLRENTRGLYNVTLWQCALSDRLGWGSLSIDPANRGHGMLVPGGDVVVATLDSLDLHDVRLIKIDVEGHESHVLNGAWATIKRDRPWLVIEDWEGYVRPLGYRMVEDWGTKHQTYLWEPV